MSGEWFVIANLDEFVDKARAIVYNNFGTWESDETLDILIDDVAEKDKEDFNKLLSHQESLVIIKQIAKRQINKKKKSIRYLINDKLFATIVEDLNARMVSNIINGLVQKGLVETAFDDKTNDFVFWVKEDNDSKENPETD